MKTKFILHGGMLSYDSPHNHSFFNEFTNGLKDGDKVLFIGFARQDLNCRQEIYERDKGYILAHTDQDLVVENAELDTLIEQTRKAKAIFVTGGHTDSLQADLATQPEFLNALKGKVYAGSSAGAMVTSTYNFACSAGEVREGLGWVGRLRRSLPTNDATSLYNFGICGETSADVLKRFQVEFAAIEPEKVIFALGINDSKFPDGSDTNLVSLTEYQQNMQWLIDIAKVTVTEIVLVGPTAVGEGFHTPRESTFRDAEISKYRDTLQAVAEKNNLKFIDLFTTLNPETDLADGVHPTTAGYQKMYEVIRANLNWG